MQSSSLPRWSLIACAAASLALPPVMAAELGEMAVLSHVGQPLLAEIELTALAPEEANGVAVRLASPDVYRGGGIGMDPALQTLTISPLERGGRHYVRVSTRQAIQAGHVHLYLLLGSGNGAVVRLGTVWLAAAPPAAAAVSAPVRPAIPLPAPVSAPLPRAAAGAPSPDAAALAARARAEGLVRPARAFVPPAAPAPAVPALRPAPLRRATAPVAACAPQANVEQAQACVALDEKNAALNEKLGELEGKLGALQKALAQPATAAAVAAPAAAPAEARVPHAKPKPLVPPAGEKAAGGNGLLWLGIGTLVFLLLTAVIVYVARKRKQAAGPGAPSKYWVLLRKPFSRKKKDVPVLTEAVEGGVGAEPEPEPFSR
ncbi:FimV family protein [Janthinobacterium lividum]|uniref:type IV pilus assembly protein FimV n=1 Tax=Janthinobacterium lividum TaxID=29581 RepID=UPI000874A5BB|nr:hypothetical protein [Janthinobacterium lividum]MCC7714539.1 hypothetical protein [Janthinobacterium lividum]OEZ55260.1 hypothetical protein JANLI_33520 [Janthinobacterium lividum]WQE30259.1 hypothetical protein U0004_07520 [Janthinobacterium lividum]STQ95758.1 Tfp pilus assembly protein FimV [Janthinobacterium lividum]